MSWTLILTLFFTNKEPKQVVIPDWFTEKTCYMAGYIIQQEWKQKEGVDWYVIDCQQGGKV